MGLLKDYSIFIFLLLAVFDQSNGQRRNSRSGSVAVGSSTKVDFDCPEEFGYFPHPTDCSQYYVCVFGGALLESCTGGLMYSHELQTCDWPRNVGCDVATGAAVASSPPQREPIRESRVRYQAPSAPAAPPSIRIAPNPVVTSRGQPRQLQPQEDIAKLYEEQETLPPAEENENDRQQRVYRGQPSTIGQVQRDRDGLANTNAIPVQGKIGAFSFGTQIAQQQPLQQYRVEPSSVAPNSFIPHERRVPSNPPSNRALYNGSQSYDPAQYDPYYTVYDDDVELYRDVDYAQQFNTNSQRPPQQTYRGTPAPAASPSPPPQRESYINQQTQYDTQSQAYQEDYDDALTAQIDDQNTYRQPTRQQIRGDRNELSYVSEPAATTRKPIPTTTTPTTTTTTTTRATTTTRLTTTQRSPPATAAPARTNNRGRGSSHYTTGSGNEAIAPAVVVNTNRGTPPPRSRPTLKPSTSIVSKAQEFVDIYRFPASRPEPIYPTPQVDKTAAKCRKDVCLLPDCSCGGKDIPGDLPLEAVPQIVLLTFDDSVNDLNKGLYSDLFEKGRTNPNGCPISATFYVSHEWTDYSQVQNLYHDGHEMASHTVSHSFGEQFSQKKWTREVAGQREILAAYGGVKLEDVRGMRAPFLSVGGNKMFKMLYDSNFTYDSSMPVYENKPPSYPYTLDYKLFHDCMIPPCPTRSYPGVWEVPMVMWQDLNGGRCSMGDACSNPPEADGVYKMLVKNFDRHYTTNRAPFGLFYHAAWFTQAHHKEGFINFLDFLVSHKDVYVITNWQALQWVRDPTPLSRLNSFQPFQCDYSDRPKKCNNPKVCNLWHKSGVRYMRTCQPCPEIYPWTGKTGIRSSRIDNDIEE